MQPLGGALLEEVVGEPAAQLAGIAADDVVFERPIMSRPLEDVHSDLMLRYLVGPALNGFGDDIEKEVREQGRAGEVPAGDGALCDLPSFVAVQQWRRLAEPILMLDDSRPSHGESPNPG